MTLATILAATSTKSSGTSYMLLILLVIFGGIYFLVLRPRQKKAQQAARGNKNFEVGDDVVTIGGVCGTVISMTDDKVVLATGLMDGDEHNAPGTVTHMTFIRQAIAKKADAPAPQTAEQEAEGNADGEGGTSS